MVTWCKGLQSQLLTRVYRRTSRTFWVWVDHQSLSAVFAQTMMHWQSTMWCDLSREAEVDIQKRIIWVLFTVIKATATCKMDANGFRRAFVTDYYWNSVGTVPAYLPSRSLLYSDHMVSFIVITSWALQWSHAELYSDHVLSFTVITSWALQWSRAELYAKVLKYPQQEARHDTRLLNISTTTLCKWYTSNNTNSPELVHGRQTVRAVHPHIRVYVVIRQRLSEVIQRHRSLSWKKKPQQRANLSQFYMNLKILLLFSWWL
jgi:hypothetical protein